MPDFGDPYAAMNTNPYLQMPQQQAPHWSQVLGNTLLGLGAGLSQADASGRGWASGIAPGLMYGNQLMAQQRQLAEQQAMKRWQMGLMAQEYAGKQQDRDLKRRQLALGADAYVPTGLQPPPPSPTMMSGVTDPAANAIAGIESAGQPNGGYGAIGPVANNKGQRAYGKYQVMDFNIGPWTQEVLGKQMTPQEFLANPQAQEAVFKTKFGQFRQQYGSDQDAASVWFSGRPLAGNTAGPDVNGTTVAGYVNKFNRGMYGGQGNTTDVQTAQAGGTRVVPPQGDAIAGQGDAPPRVTSDAPPTFTLPQRPTLDAATAQRLRTLHFADPARAAAEYKQILETQQQIATKEYEQKYEAWKHKRNQSEKDAWEPLDPKNASMYPGLEPNKAYLRNRVTGDVKPVGGAQTVVNIDNKTEAEFGKEMGKMDAQRFGKIIEAEGTMNDMASKIGFAMDQFRKTYTGPGAEFGNQLNRILGAAGFEEAGKKASAAEAALAVISQMKPHMRAAGSGASSDKDMDMFAKALPSLMNLPDGNERIATFFQKMADRATKIRELAQEHSEGGRVPLTRTQFDAEVKKLGPLFSEEERKLLEGASKAETKLPPPPPGFTIVTPGAKPKAPPPPAGFNMVTP